MQHHEVRIDRFEYRTPFGHQGHCGIEAIKLADGRVVVITTEVADNPGMSVTNAVEYLATQVCTCLQIDPRKLIWVEHYGYPAPASPKRPRTYDLVMFGRIAPAHEPMVFDPVWRCMNDKDWRDLGLEPREDM